MDAIHVGRLFEAHAKFHVWKELSNNPKVDAEQAFAGQQMVTEGMIATVAAGVEGGTAALVDLNTRAAGFSLAALWAAIVAFFESPVGKAILAALVTAILAALGL